MTPIQDYSESHIQHLLAEDPTVAEQGITVTRCENTLVLSGVVESVERRRHIERAVTERFPAVRVRCDIAVTAVREPGDVEELS